MEHFHFVGELAPTHDISVGQINSLQKREPTSNCTEPLFTANSFSGYRQLKSAAVWMHDVVTCDVKLYIVQWSSVYLVICISAKPGCPHPMCMEGRPEAWF